MNTHQSAPTGTTYQPPQLTDVQLRTMQLSRSWMDRHPTFESLCEHYSSKYWGQLLQTPLRAYEAKGPVLGCINDIYGPGSAEKWVAMQIIEILVTTRAEPNDKVWKAIQSFVASFSSSAHIFKLTELMLFFARYKNGMYETTYAAFDVRNIGQVFFHNFLAERHGELGVVEERRQVERARRERALRKSHAVSYERFRGAPQSTRYGVRLRFCIPLASIAVQDLCATFHIPYPPTSEVVETVVNKGELRALAPHAVAHQIVVEDSWEMPDTAHTPHTAPAP